MVAPSSTRWCPSLYYGALLYMTAPSSTRRHPPLHSGVIFFGQQHSSMHNSALLYMVAPSFAQWCHFFSYCRSDTLHFVLWQMRIFRWVFYLLFRLLLLVQSSNWLSFLCIFRWIHSSTTFKARVWFSIAQIMLYGQLTSTDFFRFMIISYFLRTIFHYLRIQTQGVAHSRPSHHYLYVQDGNSYHQQTYTTYFSV